MSPGRKYPPLSLRDISPSREEIIRASLRLPEFAVWGPGVSGPISPFEAEMPGRAEGGKAAATEVSIP
jgi:hypothetical protein